MGGPREGHLQILRCVDSNVDMNDPRWPSLREAARRFLREDGCTLSVPEGLEKDAWEIVQLIADHVPSKIDLPNVVTGELAVIGLAQIGGREPPIEVCWVPDCGWEEFSEQILDLLEADILVVLDVAVPEQKKSGMKSFRRDQFLVKYCPIFYRYYSTCLKDGKTEPSSIVGFPRPNHASGCHC